MLTFGFIEQATGLMSLTGSEDLTLTDPAVFPWSVTIDSGPLAVTGVYQNGVEIGFDVPTFVTNEAQLSFIGGAYVIGAVSGLPLQPVTDFDLEVS